MLTGTAAFARHRSGGAANAPKLALTGGDNRPSDPRLLHSTDYSEIPISRSISLLRWRCISRSVAAARSTASSHRSGPPR